MPLWRYMELTKFACMLADRGLFFPNAASFEDTLEGCVTEEYARRRREEVDREFKAAKPFYDARIREFQNPAGRTFKERTAEEYAEAQAAMAAAAREQWIRESRTRGSLAAMAKRLRGRNRRN